ncbi:UDP-glycosyltransferase 208E1 [Daphnia sinensis]|uniref:UDP-glycosyltransferase 208E1 n=1 Tax=Daphnia sinensis TaxID=1820382 RepID=A0AAD5LBS3_9CRUS|nr:UDP-glycosyltransferase 208E1 [Daphnia sinensis]
MIATFILLLMASLISTGTSHKILILSPITTPSHTNVLTPLVITLANRGHQVTYWNGLKPSLTLNSTPNLRMLYSPNLQRINSDHQIGFNDRKSPFRLLMDIPKRMLTYCTAVFQDPVFHHLMKSTERYDLLIIEGVFNECSLILAEILDTPFIYFNCMSPPPWLLYAVGSPLSLEQFPHPGFSYTDEMNLWQRTLNSVVGVMVVYFHRWYVMSIVDHLAAEMFGKGNLTSVVETQDRYLSLLMTNIHFSINYQLPTSPAVVQVGGLYCVPPKALPDELESFVNGSGDAGFILVSFGSILKGAEMSDGIRRLLLSTFARLKQRVVMKWENESKIGCDEIIPPNVKLLPWLPQQDLLGHPKIKLFINHGGLNSKQEAVYHGVPFIALPVFADQPINAQKARDDGYAILLDWDNLSEDILYDSIQQMLVDPRFALRMKHVSTLMHDQMDKPLDRAVYWIEYVIRHEGASHLRSSSRKLSLYQRGFLDVLLVVLVFTFLMAYLLFRLCRCFASCGTSSTSAAKKDD